MWASKCHFWITPYKNRHSLKLMEICQIKPYTSIGDYFVPFFLLLANINVVLIYRQQAPPSLHLKGRDGRLEGE